jgi:heterodisulfide reductase subunit A
MADAATSIVTGAPVAGAGPLPLRPSYDVLVVGGGIAGMESALTLGDMGYKVLLVEKEASIGGKMILLSKVFPTLDCASCISTPKMAATSHHPNVTTLLYSEIDAITRDERGWFRVKLRRKPTFVDWAACTGCGECEIVCTVAIPDEFNANLVARRATHIAFPQAVPKKAVVDRFGTSPCSFTCPAGVKAHGYVSLVRAGKYEEAFRLHMEDAPLPGSLSRACYAPCEGECTRGSLEGTVPIRAIKRFMVDRYYAEHPAPEYGPPESLRPERVAIVGSGPSGLSAAYHLARRGYGVTVFEGAPQAGGMLRYGIPAYRLPKDVVDRDILNITALGVEIRTASPVRSLAGLKADGYDAVYLAAGTMEGAKAGVPGEDLDGVLDCMGFLTQTSGPEPMDLTGKTVVVVGGGNSAIDPARTAIRLGARKVVIQYRRSRKEMPAHDWEVAAALEEGVELQELKAPKRFVGEGGRLKAIESLTMRLGEPDASGRRSPVPVEGSERTMPADLVVLAIGLKPSTAPFAGELALNRNGTVKADPETLATSLPFTFAGGDAVTGPSMIVQAIGQGKRAAFFIDRFLRGEPVDGVRFDEKLPVADKAEVVARTPDPTPLPASRRAERAVAERITGMVEVELPVSEDEARQGAARCLDCGGCSECHQCVQACPAGAFHFEMREQKAEETVRSVVVSTGFKLFDGRRKPLLGYGRYPNVIDAMEMDRLLAPTRPYNAVLRPSDGKAPDNIAYVLCTGSRDCTVDHRLCSRVCCMYSLKQSQLILGALPLADVTIYYMDIRAFGKGYEEFFQQARGMGINFVKGKVAQVEGRPNGNLVVAYEDIEGGGGRKRQEHDLVVLSIGLQPNREALRLFPDEPLEADPDSYVREVDEDLEPGRTSIPGVFVAGTASAARDIPDTVLHSGAAAAQTAAYLKRMEQGR